MQLFEVFTNLITNAVKYNDKPFGERIVRLGSTMSGVGVATNLVPNNTLVFYVRDNGIGIPIEHHGDIFKIFRRLHGRDQFGGGSGAGLTITQTIIERHNGVIWTESEPECGATFYFALWVTHKVRD
jgi:signal transduction histidine kinase